MIRYQKLTEDKIDTFIQMRINQLLEEGATRDVDFAPALKDYYFRHMADGTFVSWIAMDGDKIVGTLPHQTWAFYYIRISVSSRIRTSCNIVLNRIKKERNSWLGIALNDYCRVT